MTVTVTPEETTHAYAQNLIVTVSVQGNSSTPTGSVVLSSGSYNSTATTLSNGSANFYIQPGSLAQGSNTLTATYTPDANSSKYSMTTGSSMINIVAPGKTSVTVNIDTLANRHYISPYIYGVNTTNKNTISDLKPTLTRFGGNATSVYNWKLFTYNAGGDWFFEDFSLSTDSVALTQYTMSQGSHMLTTMPMLNWVAAEAENGTNKHWSYPISTYGAQCSHDPFNPDAGNGQKPDCSTPVTTNAITSPYYPLVDNPSDCTTGNCLYRSEWTAALSSAFGSATCNVPYSSITSCHFYDLDNEPEIWDGPHRDVHPVHPGYTELSDSFVKGARNLKSWDPNAVRFGPVTSGGFFLWMAGGNGDNKGTHAGIDFVPWWLNQINWLDQISGSRSLDVFDVHAYYGDNISTNGFTNPQMRTEVNKYVRSYWDPTYASAAYDQDWITTTQTNRSVPFYIPRLKALVNAIYPGMPLSFSEWSPSFNEWEFATALSDVDAYGAMGREGLSFSTRWGAPDATDSTTNLPHPNYYSFQLYTNYDGAGSGFGTLSVSDQSNVNPDVFVSYAALDTTGKKLTIVVLNKDAGHDADVTFNLAGFSASSYTTYTVASTNPGHIVGSSSTAWSATQSFAANSITLVVVNGNQTAAPASEWYLNPDDLMVPASGTGVLNPKIMSGSANVTLSSAVFDAFEGAAACNGTLTLTNPLITPSAPATIAVNPGSAQGFCHYTVTGNDGTSTQTQSGWIVVGQPAATFAKSGGDNQTGGMGTALPQTLNVTLSNVPAGLSRAGASILFTTSGGTVSNGTTSGSKVIAITNSSGVASVTLTLPSSPGTVTVTAKDQFAMGAATVTFNEVAN